MIQHFQFWMNAGNVNQGSEACVNCVSSGAAGHSTDQTMDMSSLQSMHQSPPGIRPPEFPLFPPSKGFCIPMKKYVETFQQTVEKNILSLNVDSAV
jgi:hypothetical protein